MYRHPLSSPSSASFPLPTLNASLNGKLEICYLAEYDSPFNNSFLFHILLEHSHLMVLSHFLRHWRPFSRFVPLRSMQLFGALCTPILLEVLQEAAVASSLIILQVAEEPEGPRHLTSVPASKYTPAHHVFLGQ